MQNFQYKLIKHPQLVDARGMVDVEKLNTIGRQGFEIAAVDKPNWVFKREGKNMKPVEYKIIYHSVHNPQYRNQINEEKLNELGRLGWDLVSVEGSRWVFQRKC